MQPYEAISSTLPHGHPSPLPLRLWSLLLHFPSPTRRRHSIHADSTTCDYNKPSSDLPKKMKIALNILIALISLTNYTLNAVENQPYTLIEKHDAFEIRHYPSAAIAQLPISGDSYRSILNRGFRSLASYIFGKNDRSEKIAMTAPVIYTANSQAPNHTPYQGTLAFIMPQALPYENLPHPENPEIILSRTPPTTIAHLAFGGFLKFAGYKTFQKKEQELLALIQQYKLTSKGPIQHLYYTDPFNLSPRYAVAIEIIPPNITR